MATISRKKLDALIAERDRNVKEKKELKKKFANRAQQMTRMAGGAPMPRGFNAAGALTVSRAPRWATRAQWASFSGGVGLLHSFPTLSTTERYFKQVLLGRTPISCAAGTGFAIVWNPSQSPNDILKAQATTAAPVGNASTAVIYTGITLAGTIFGTGSTPLNLGGQYTSSIDEQGVGWNRHLGAEFKITQTNTPFVRGAQVYQSTSDKEYSVFTWDPVGGAFVGADIATLQSASHTGTESIDFRTGTEILRVPGTNPDALPLVGYSARNQASRGAGGAIGPADVSAASIPDARVYPPVLGEIAPLGWTRYILVFPYDQANASTYLITTEMVNECVRFTPTTTGKMDPVFSTVPNQTWVADPAAVARDANAMASGRGSYTGFRLDASKVAAALGSVLSFADKAYQSYQSSRGPVGTGVPYGVNPTFGGGAPMGIPVNRSSPMEDGFVSL